ncbi:MAG: membrane protein [Gemmatimonadota bacterium]
MAVAPRRPVPDAAALAVPQPLRPEDEAQRVARLRRMKAWALALLVLATVVFTVARYYEAQYPWLGIVRATAEASMIGGLADWFAVTALFRHPLGIPIPHTAIIPARKDRVGQTLGAFVQKNFLNRDVIVAKLHTLNAAERMAQWMVEPGNARRIARQLARALAAAANVLRDEDVQEFISKAVVNRVRTTQVAPLLGKALSVLTAGNRHQALLDDAIRLLARGISENQDLIRERVEQESPWWIPGAIDDKIAGRIVRALENTMQAVHADPNHPLRQRFDAAIDEFIVKLQASPEVILKAEQIKEDLLHADTVRQFSASLWADAKASIARHAEHPEGFDPETIERGLTAFGNAILADPVLMEKVDAWLVEAVVAVVERYQDEVGELIAGTVRRWDPVATSQRIELAIGRDLQFIRINGTIVGGLAGMGLYLLQRAI